MKNIIIRTAIISDLEAIQKLNQELCVKENREYDRTINIDYPFSKNGEDYFRSRIESADSLALIAEENKNTIGYLVGSIIAPETYRTITRMAEAENMYVKESFRGLGIGSQLNQRFEDWWRKNRAQRIRYVASAGNIEAIKLYKKLGSKEVNITLEKELD